MKLIVGLGNPGKKYENTRHNCGFLVVDELLEKCGITLSQEKWNAQIVKATIQGQQVLIMKPLTYMNESGLAVIQAVNYYHLESEDILIIHDDMDLPIGAVRIRAKGSGGGQKGIKSIIEHLGTSEFMRIRVGVGHSISHEYNAVADWVLSPVPKVEQKEWKEAILHAANAAYAWISESKEVVMRFNKKGKPKQEDDNAE